ncbi:MAG TPA: hypothetical protein VM937_13270 [Burkholderiaceae bacterium]|nr:hypothetical protein [Burkholderiaceae bacterium]
MRWGKRVTVYGAGLFIAAGFGLAPFEAQAVRSDNIEVKVTSSTSSLSLGKPGAFTFYIANQTNGTINSVRFRATLSAGEFAESNPINSGAPASCTRVDPQNIDCSVGGGIANFGYTTFDFAFTAPASGTQVILNWNVRFGQGHSENFIRTGSTPGAEPTTVSLIADSTTKAEAYIPAAGGPSDLFTGTAIPGTDDPFTVKMVVDPTANKVITGRIDESVTCLQPTHKCVKLNVLRKETQSNGELLFFPAAFTGNPTTTDLDEKLVFVLRLAASEVAGKSINHVSLFYIADGSTVPIEIPACPKRKPAYVPAVEDPPCLARKIEYTKRTAPVQGLIGGWEFEFWAAKNGFIDVAF